MNHPNQHFGTARTNPQSGYFLAFDIFIPFKIDIVDNRIASSIYKWLNLAHFTLDQINIKYLQQNTLLDKTYFALWGRERETFWKYNFFFQESIFLLVSEMIWPRRVTFLVSIIRFWDDRDKIYHFVLPRFECESENQIYMISSESKLKYIIGYTSICFTTSIILVQAN